MRRSLILTLAIGTLGAAACGDAAVTGLALGGTGNVVISVGSGTTPTLSWTGGNATRLTVTQSSGGGVHWDLQALDATGVPGPVVFGVVPNGAAENSQSVVLTAGTDYRVNLTLVDGSTGSRVFRP